MVEKGRKTEASSSNRQYRYTSIYVHALTVIIMSVKSGLPWRTPGNRMQYLDSWIGNNSQVCTSIIIRIVDVSSKEIHAFVCSSSTGSDAEVNYYYTSDVLVSMATHRWVTVITWRISGYVYTSFMVLLHRFHGYWLADGSDVLQVVSRCNTTSLWFSVRELICWVSSFGCHPWLSMTNRCGLWLQAGVIWWHQQTNMHASMTCDWIRREGASNQEGVVFLMQPSNKCWMLWGHENCCGLAMQKCKIMSTHAHMRHSDLNAVLE